MLIGVCVCCVCVCVCVCVCGWVGGDVTGEWGSARKQKMMAAIKMFPIATTKAPRDESWRAAHGKGVRASQPAGNRAACLHNGSGQRGTTVLAFASAHVRLQLAAWRRRNAHFFLSIRPSTFQWKTHPLSLSPTRSSPAAPQPHLMIDEAVCILDFGQHATTSCVTYRVTFRWSASSTGASSTNW